MRVHPEFVNEKGSDEENRCCKHKSDDVRHLVAITQAVNKRARPRFRRDRAIYCGGRCGHHYWTREMAFSSLTTTGFGSLAYDRPSLKLCPSFSIHFKKSL